MGFNLLFFGKKKKLTIRSIFDWAVQNLDFERASVGTFFNKQDLIETADIDVARFEYDSDTGTYLGLLYEESRENILYPSEVFENSNWENGNVTRLDNQESSPDGTTAAAMITASAIAYGGILRNYHAGYAANTQYAGSVFVKKGNHSYVGIALGDQGSAIFNLDTGVLISASSTLDSYEIKKYQDDWWNIRAIATQPSSPNGYFDVYLTDSSGSIGWTPTGTEYIYVWGAQLEAGDSVTSYIKTIDSFVTRSIDKLTFDIPEDATYLTVTFDDGSTQEISVTGGTSGYVLDASALDRTHIKKIAWGTEYLTTSDGYTLGTSDGYVLTVAG